MQPIGYSLQLGIQPGTGRDVHLKLGPADGTVLLSCNPNAAETRFCAEWNGALVSDLKIPDSAPGGPISVRARIGLFRMATAVSTRHRLGASSAAANSACDHAHGLRGEGRVLRNGFSQEI